MLRDTSLSAFVAQYLLFRGIRRFSELIFYGNWDFRQPTVLHGLEIKRVNALEFCRIIVNDSEICRWTVLLPNQNGQTTHICNRKPLVEYPFYSPHSRDDQNLYKHNTGYAVPRQKKDSIQIIHHKQASHLFSNNYWLVLNTVRVGMK